MPTSYEVVICLRVLFFHIRGRPSKVLKATRFFPSEKIHALPKVMNNKSEAFVMR